MKLFNSSDWNLGEMEDTYRARAQRRKGDHVRGTGPRARRREGMQEEKEGQTGKWMIACSGGGRKGRGAKIVLRADYHYCGGGAVTEAKEKNDLITTRKKHWRGGPWWQYP